MSKITDIVMRIQNELRKEGITGIDAMHHITMILISKSLDEKQCSQLNIPVEFTYENMMSLTDIERFDKFYDPEDFDNCLYHYIRDENDFGYQDITFQISSATSLGFCYSQLSKIDTEELFNKIDLIGDIYEHFINREGKSMKDLGQYFTDRTLIKYLVNIIDPKINDKGVIQNVWDPASGTGGFLIEYIANLNRKYENIDWTKNKHEIYGNDINKTTASLLKNNLYYSLKQMCGSSIEMQDSLKMESEIKFDNILANPPFGVKGLKYCDSNQSIKSLEINGTKGEILFLQLCMVKLNENGKCAVIIPEGVLFNSTKMYKNTRKHLLENFNLKKVIKVGEGEFFKNTGVKTSVLYFENTGPTESVEFIQVDKVDDQIVEVPLMTVEMEKIVENDYSLNMNLYKEITYITNTTYDIKTLLDVTHGKRGQSIKVKGEGLSGDYPIVSGGTKICGYYHKYNREENTILISSSGQAGYVSKYPSKLWASDCWSIHSNDETYLTNGYLYYVLRYLQDTIYEYQSGAVIKHIAFKDIKQLKIPVPPLEVQNRIVEQLDNIYETEIESSKKIVDSLKMSIETIMKNTMYRDDLQEYKIKDVCEFKSGKRITKKEHTGTKYPVYGGGNISFYTDEPNNRDGFNILLSIFGSSGKISLVNGPIFLHDNGCSINSTKQNIYNKYIGIYLQSFNEHVYSYKRQTGVPTLDIESFKNYKIRIPPIEVQQQILEKIEPKERLIQDLENNIERAHKEAKDIMSVLFN